MTVTSGDVEKEVNVLVSLTDVKAPMADQLVFAKNYKTSRFSWDGIFAMLGSHDCRLDDEMDINIDGTYLYNGGSSLCGNEDDQRLKTGIGTWMRISSL